jgi:anti-sigma regulatory factor (Ser/Thr protein kinase)
MIGDDPELSACLRDAAFRDCEIETAPGAADALQRLRQRSFDVVVTNPQTSMEEDLALLGEMRLIQPGLRTIILAPETIPEDVIAAMRARVFACFKSPFNPVEVVRMVERALEVTDWRDGIEVLSAERDWISLRVACRMLTAERLVNFMKEFESDVPDSQRADLITAFREILLNAMEHGAGFDPEQVVEVSAVRTERALIYHFRDPGPGFRRDALPHAAISNPPEDPMKHLEEQETRGLRPGGFGILLTQQLVDELIYNEAGNEVLLIKYTA